jgi:hypothetical protein
MIYLFTHLAAMPFAGLTSYNHHFDEDSAGVFANEKVGLLSIFYTHQDVLFILQPVLAYFSLV